MYELQVLHLWQHPYSNDVLCMPRGSGRLTLEDAGGADASHDERWAEYVSKHRCDSASRGSVYDSRAGAVTCGYCTQPQDVDMNIGNSKGIF